MKRSHKPGKEAPAGSQGVIMSLTQQILSDLARWKGTASASPQTVTWHSGSGIVLEVDFTIIDSLGCAFRELRVSAPALRDEPLTKLKAWADRLSHQVTYLLEHLAPLETDQAAQAVLVRSSPPTRQPAETTYYEVLVQAPGTLTLRRYARTQGSDTRTAREIQVTHEVLVRLVDDLVQAIPAHVAV
jgi:hypothetical protein